MLLDFFIDDKWSPKELKAPSKPSATAQENKRMLDMHGKMYTAIIPWLLTPDPGNDRAADLPLQTTVCPVGDF